jgi:hypothetical protein
LLAVAVETSDVVVAHHDDRLRELGAVWELLSAREGVGIGSGPTGGERIANALERCRFSPEQQTYVRRWITKDLSLIRRQA